MSANGWMIVVAGLGAALVTALFGLALFWLQGRRESRAALWQARRSAYAKLLARTGVLVHTGGALRIIAEAESDRLSRLETMLHIRKPTDALGLSEFMHHQMDLLYEAWGEVWTCGTPEAIRLGNLAVDAGTEVVGVAMETEARRPRPSKDADESSSLEPASRWQEKVHALAEARRDFACLAREELGVDMAEILLGDRAE